VLEKHGAFLYFVVVIKIPNMECKTLLALGESLSSETCRSTAARHLQNLLHKAMVMIPKSCEKTAIETADSVDEADEEAAKDIGVDLLPFDPMDWSFSD
jgi:hypothetical protein